MRHRQQCNPSLKGVCHPDPGSCDPGSRGAVIRVVRHAGGLTHEGGTRPCKASQYPTKAEDAWGSKNRRSVADFLGLGFTGVKWNGIEPRPLIDAQGRVFEWGAVNIEDSLMTHPSF
ncbi:hypothetical protein B0H11DRAFT_1935686 [Mycena galericulata]|nr:hypothetical protein B0H11DRAFT_1935686 [Mycena galericulata]